MEHEKLVEIITTEVLRRLSSKDIPGHPQAGYSKKALVVFTGGTIGLKSGLRK
ncbi:hypothetical protein N752_16625 [Desulforamulus aquiferis]|nr:hypothetical protein [Desulforamulus aquiferis]RYD04014.1 hypothetical protein N752_16625 [Desulforamulus aquiferis]